jgi:hypothetical protein
MRIRQLFLGLDYSTWRPFKIKYGFRNYSEINEPAVFYGMYTKNHYNILMSHRGLSVVVWAGSDSMNIPPYLVRFFHENKHRVFHLAYSHWIKHDLDFHGIEYIEKPIFGMDFDDFRFSGIRGDRIYNYHARKEARDFYGHTFMVNLVKKYPAIHVELCVHGQHKRKLMQEVYDRCFMGVRMTTHDQMGLSVIEMGLLGKRSVFNGNVPCALNFRNEQEAEDLILEYWANPPDPDRLLAEEMREFVRDDEKWLDTSYYG